MLAPLILPTLETPSAAAPARGHAGAGAFRRAREPRRRGPRRAGPSVLDRASPVNLPIHIERPDRNRPEPLWHQTERALRALIADGTWPDGAQLPNEAKLSEMLGVSRITMRHALRNMEEWGLLRREQGRGTFVRSSTVIAGARGPTSLTQEMADRGLSVGSRILELREIPADNAIASALEIREGARSSSFAACGPAAASRSASRPRICRPSACPASPGSSEPLALALCHAARSLRPRPAVGARGLPRRRGRRRRTPSFSRSPRAAPPSSSSAPPPTRADPTSSPSRRCAATATRSDPSCACDNQRKASAP